MTKPGMIQKTAEAYSHTPFFLITPWESRGGGGGAPKYNWSSGREGMFNTSMLAVYQKGPSWLLFFPRMEKVNGPGIISLMLVKSVWMVG